MSAAPEHCWEKNYDQADRRAAVVTGVSKAMDAHVVFHVVSEIDRQGETLVQRG